MRIEGKIISAYLSMMHRFAAAAVAAACLVIAAKNKNMFVRSFVSSRDEEMT